ncbi:hypothetical protein SteCoe_32365 [Stentor coeruleus]|uniref:Uncharacterized protein n=1 Tax=Stentor coeruleus TaxID=5963 RepID=A0A1R2AZ45_9CILI|nr:hypothetical protein SteCoe_32365 [Stentor coeruleus]
MQDSNFELFYSHTEGDEGSSFSPGYRTGKQRYPILQKQAYRPKYIRCTKSPLEDKLNLSSQNFCESCIKHMRKNEELSKQNKFLSEKCLTTERHLKQYDNLLEIKDYRLQQQELALKKDIEIFSMEKEKFLKDKEFFEELRTEFFKDHEGDLISSEQLESKFEELAEKKRELVEILKNIETKSYELNKKEENQGIYDKYKERLIISREQDIQRLMGQEQMYESRSSTPVFNKKSESVAYRKYSVNEKTQDSNINLLELFEIKAKIEKEQKELHAIIDQKTQDLEIREKKLAVDKESLEFTQERVAEELESIDQLKIILNTQMKNLERERALLHQNYNEKLKAFMIFDKKNQKFESKDKVHRKNSSIDDLRSYTEPKDVTFRENPNNPENLLKEYEMKYKDCEFKLKETEDKNQQIEAKFKQQEETLKEFIEKVHTYEIKFKEHENHNKEFESKMKNYQVEIDFYKNQLNSTETKREEQLKLTSQLSEKIKSIKTKKRDIKKKVLELEKNLKNYSEGLSTRSYNEECCIKCLDLEKKYTDSGDKIIELNEKNKNLEQKLGKLIQINAELQKTAEEYRAEIMSMEERVFTLENCTEAPDTYTTKVKMMSEELQMKLNQIKTKENELKALEKHLMREKESIDAAAQFVKNINEDLDIQKQSLIKEKNTVENQKLCLEEIEKKQQEKAKFLQTKQEELVLFREKLCEREKFFQHKGQRLSMPDIPSLNLSFLDT